MPYARWCERVRCAHGKTERALSSWPFHQGGDQKTPWSYGETPRTWTTGEKYRYVRLIVVPISQYFPAWEEGQDTGTTGHPIGGCPDMSRLGVRDLSGQCPAMSRLSRYQWTPSKFAHRKFRHVRGPSSLLPPVGRLFSWCPVRRFFWRKIQPSKRLH